VEPVTVYVGDIDFALGLDISGSDVPIPAVAIVSSEDRY
jgi:hypothetical protein